MSLTINGETLLEVHLHVPQYGAWWADVVFGDAPNMSGAVDLVIGELRLRGTLSTRYDGVFGRQRRGRVMAGAGGWGTLVERQHYHNDAGVRARTVAEDLARLAGETLAVDFAPELESLGLDYVRRTGPAARHLEEVIGSAGWWVGYDGETVVGTRPSLTPPRDSYDVLDFDPRARVATLGVARFDAIEVGAVLDGEGLEEPLTVRDLELIITPHTARLRAWGGGGPTSRSRLGDSLQTLVRRLSPDPRLLVPNRYRVYRMSGDRVELQIVAPATGLPDVIPVAMRPGVAGAHAKLAEGAFVLVEFVEGDPRQPVITGFGGRDEGDSAVPEELDLDAKTAVRLIAGATSPVALAPLVQAEIDELWTALKAHIHTAPSGATGTPEIPPIPPPPPPAGGLDGSAGEVGAEKVFGE